MSIELESFRTLLSNPSAPLPRWLRGIADAPDELPIPVVKEAVELLGFRQLFQLSVMPGAGKAKVMVSTLPERWAQDYLRFNLVAEDPCVMYARYQALPALVRLPDGRTRPASAYRDCVRKLGLASFFALSFHGYGGDFVVSQFGLEERDLDRISTAWLSSCSGDALLLAHVVYHIRARRSVKEMRSGPATAASERELECLALASLGHKCEAIAGLLRISVHTVRFHLRNIRARLKSRTVSSALAAAMQDPVLASAIAQHRLQLAPVGRASPARTTPRTAAARAALAHQGDEL
jgi:DNA-binding CsgD family transcriptional regulator